MHETTPMTWERLKEKLRAHGVPGWRDESPRVPRVPQEEGTAQLTSGKAKLAAPQLRQRAESSGPDDCAREAKD